MVQVAQTVKPTVEPKMTMSDAINNYKDVKKNSAVKNYGFSLSNLITDIANTAEAEKKNKRINSCYWKYI